MAIRMLGFNGKKDVDIENLDEVQTEVFNKYSKRYHFDKIRRDLKSDWRLKFYSNPSGP